MCGDPDGAGGEEDPSAFVGGDDHGSFDRVDELGLCVLVDGDLVACGVVVCENGYGPVDAEAGCEVFICPDVDSFCLHIGNQPL